MRCVPASIGSNVAGHCFGCYHPKSWQQHEPKISQALRERGFSNSHVWQATDAIGISLCHSCAISCCIISTVFVTGSTHEHSKNLLPSPIAATPVVCTLLPIGSCPAFQCCTQTDQLGIQHLNPRPYLWQPQIEHLYPSSTTKTLWSCMVMLMVPPHSFGCNVTEAIWWQLLPGNPWTFSICSGHVGTMAWIEGSRTNGRKMC